RKSKTRKKRGAEPIPDHGRTFPNEPASENYLSSVTPTLSILLREIAKSLLLRRVLDGIEALGIKPQQIPGLLHVRGQRRGGVDDAAAGMRDHDAPRQKVQPVLQSAGQI